MSDEAGQDDIAVPDQRNGAEGRGCILKSMCRVGCAARVLQMGKITGNDSFKVGRLFLTRGEWGVGMDTTVTASWKTG